MKIVGKLVLGFILILTLAVAVSANTSADNWSFNSGSVGDVLTRVAEPVSIKTVEVLNEISAPHGVNIWTSDPVAVPAENASVGSDPWSTSGPVSSPSTQGLANSNGWA